MRNILDPLTGIPGVRVTAIISPDGVPIDVRANEPMRGTEGASGDSNKSAARANERARGQHEATNSAEGDDSLSEHSALEFGAEDINALAALTSSWISEISRAVAPLSWEVPKRLVLGAARGTLIVVQVPRALLVVVIEAGVRPEELRLPMGVAIARMERHLRAVELRSGGGKLRSTSEPAGIRPSSSDTKNSGSTPKGNVKKSGNEVPDASGE